MILQLLWSHCEGTLGSFCMYFRGHFKVILGYIVGHFGSTLELLRGNHWCDFGSPLGSFCWHSGVTEFTLSYFEGTLESLWEYSGVTLGVPWGSLGVTLRSI